MPFSLLLCASLALGQAPATPAEAPAPPPAPTTPATERWLLMKALQGTWPGGLLDSERLRSIKERLLSTLDSAGSLVKIPPTPLAPPAGTAGISNE